MSQSTSPARREATRPSALRSDTPRRVSFEQQRAEEEKSAGWSRLGEKEIEKAQKDVAQSARPQRMGSPSPSRGPSREARTVLVGQPAAPAGGSGREVGAEPTRGEAARQAPAVQGGHHRTTQEPPRYAGWEWHRCNT